MAIRESAVRLKLDAPAGLKPTARASHLAAGLDLRRTLDVEDDGLMVFILLFRFGCL